MTAGDPPDRVVLDSPVARRLFGDRWGLAVFLVAVCGLAVLWRAGSFITDTATIVRTLEAVADGRLRIDVVTGEHFAAPGAVVSDGFVYGRNYGQVALAVPLLWGLDILSALSNLRVGLVVGWHLLVLALVHTVGRLLDRPWRVGLVGSTVVAAAVLANLSVLTTFGGTSQALLALQLLGLLAAGGLAVGTYRLVATFHPGRVAVAAGLAGALVLPIGFWAQLPKRHVLVSLIVVWLLYAFARSRVVADGTAIGRDHSARYRAGAYGLVGLLAWIHAAEGIFVLVALAAVDLPTAPSNDGRTLALIGGAFGLSLVPFLATNGTISGDVLAPPRTLPSAISAESVSSGVLGGGTSGDPNTSSGGSGLAGVAVIGEFVWLASVILAQAGGSLTAMDSPGVVLRTWVRSGSLERFVGGGLPEYRAVNLAVLEVAPILAGLVAASASSAVARPRSALERVRAVDALALAIAVAFVLLYMQRLPLHVQITVRYLLPVYPIGLFLLIRQRPIRRLVTERTGLLAWSFAGTVLVGSQLLLLSVLLADLTVAEAAQLHAILGLVAAGLLGLSVVGDRIEPRLGTVAAGLLGVAAGLGSAFVLLSGLAYFSFIGRYVLPAVQVLAEAIGRI